MLVCVAIRGETPAAPGKIEGTPHDSEKRCLLVVANARLRVMPPMMTPPGVAVGLEASRAEAAREGACIG